MHRSEGFQERKPPQTDKCNKSTELTSAQVKFHRAHTHTHTASHTHTPSSKTHTSPHTSPHNTFLHKQTIQFREHTSTPNVSQHTHSCTHPHLLEHTQHNAPCFCCTHEWHLLPAGNPATQTALYSPTAPRRVAPGWVGSSKRSKTRVTSFDVNRRSALHRAWRVTHTEPRVIER